MINSDSSTIVKAFEAIPFFKGNSLHCPALTAQIEPSKLTCLVGPHRAQLRAYLFMLAAIRKPVSGEVTLLGQNTALFDRQAWKKMRSQVGYLSGFSPLLSTKDGLMNVMLPILYHSSGGYAKAAKKARNLLIEMGCDFELTTYPAQLTSFQRLQLALARALICAPQLLVLDVPFHDLGVSCREEMGDLLGKYQQGRSVCMIGGLQYPHFLEKHAQQIIFISEHKIIKFSSWSSFTQTTDQEVLALLSVI